MRIWDAIHPDFKLPTQDFDETGLAIYWGIVPMNLGWCDYIYKTFNLEFEQSFLFCRKAGQIDDIAHVDTHATKHIDLDSIVINWCIGGKGSNLIWYQRPTQDPDVSEHIDAHGNGTNTIYRGWPVNTLQEIDRCEILRIPTLTRVTVPHSVITGSQPRYCFSIRFKSWGHNSWEETVQDFQQRGWIDVDTGN